MHKLYIDGFTNKIIYSDNHDSIQKHWTNIQNISLIRINSGSNTTLFRERYILQTIVIKRLQGI